MSPWPNRGASGGPCGGAKKRDNFNTQATHLTLRPTRSDSSQPASAKPGVVHKDGCARTQPLGGVGRLTHLVFHLQVAHRPNF
jgi:hypothetical protein